MNGLETRREEQKERILKAAMAVFAHHGYSETKMSDIAAAAQVSYGLAYHYFASKDAVSPCRSL